MKIIGANVRMSKESELQAVVWELMCMGVYEGPSGEELEKMSLNNLYLLKTSKEQKV